MAKKTTQTKPLLAEDEYSIVMTADEMVSIIQILSFSKEVFEQMSINASKEGDENTMALYASRSRLSYLLFNKFRTIANIGEPTSREVH